MKPLLQVVGLTKRFGGIVACDGISFTADRGETVAIIGPNGAGKTTLFSCIAAEQRPTSGHVLVDGVDLTARSQVAAARAGIGRTYQITRPFLGLSVVENVMVGPLEQGLAIRRAEEIAMAALAEVALASSSHLPASALSTGQRKRLEMARVLARRPKLLLLDEMSGGVDRTNVPEVVAAIRNARSADRLIVLIEHNMKVVRQVAERVIAIIDGKVALDGPPEEVLTDARVVSAYLGSSYRTEATGAQD